MPEEIQQTSQSDVSDVGTASEAGNGDAGNSQHDLLGTLSKATGREFKTVEDFESHYKNLSSMVGDNTIAEQRKKAEGYQKVLEEIKDLAEEQGVSPEAYLEYSIKDAKKQVDSVTPREYVEQKQQTEELISLKEKVGKADETLKKLELEKQIPGSEKYFEDFKRWAGTDVEVSAEAFKKSPFNSLVEAERKSANTSVIESNSRIANTTKSDVEKAKKKAMQSGSIDDWAEFERLRLEAAQ